MYMYISGCVLAILYRYGLMSKCWEYDGGTRPTFKDIYTYTCSYITRIANYLKMDVNPFHNVPHAGQSNGISAGGVADASAGQSGGPTDTIAGQSGRPTDYSGMGNAEVKERLPSQ